MLKKLYVIITTFYLISFVILLNYDVIGLFLFEKLYFLSTSNSLISSITITLVNVILLTIFLLTKKRTPGILLFYFILFQTFFLTINFRTLYFDLFNLFTGPYGAIILLLYYALLLIFILYNLDIRSYLVNNKLNIIYFSTVTILLIVSFSFVVDNIKLKNEMKNNPVFSNLNRVGDFIPPKYIFYDNRYKLQEYVFQENPKKKIFFIYDENSTFWKKHISDWEKLYNSFNEKIAFFYIPMNQKEKTYFNNDLILVPVENKKFIKFFHCIYIPQVFLVDENNMIINLWIGELSKDQITELSNKLRNL